MKKIIGIIAMLLISIVTYSQDIIKTKGNSLGVLDKESNTFIYGEYTKANIDFTFRENYITADDKSASVYRLREKFVTSTTSEYKKMMALCWDEKDDACVISLTIYTSGERYLAVVYETVAIVYTIY